MKEIQGDPHLPNSPEKTISPRGPKKRSFVQSLFDRNKLEANVPQALIGLFSEISEKQSSFFGVMEEFAREKSIGGFETIERDDKGIVIEKNDCYLGEIPDNGVFTGRNLCKPVSSIFTQILQQRFRDNPEIYVNQVRLRVDKYSEPKSKHTPYTIEHEAVLIVADNKRFIFDPTYMQCNSESETPMAIIPEDQWEKKYKNFKFQFQIHNNVLSSNPRDSLSSLMPTIQEIFDPLSRK